MRKVLTFIGTGSAFSKENLSNSAYYLKEDKLVLFDCGETIFHEIRKLNLINEKIKKIDIIITHLHSDHSGSLGSLILYCNKMQLQEINVIFPIKDMIYALLNLFGVPKNIYNTKIPDEISDYYLQSFEQVHGCVSKDGFIERMPSYGYHFINDNDNLFYSGDTTIIQENILQMFKEKKIYYLYQDITTSNNKSHLPLNELEKIIDKKYRHRIMCMHLEDDANINQIKELGFNTSR
jgi:ribonuclease BN (tRNA processing enzyme)